MQRSWPDALARCGADLWAGRGAGGAVKLSPDWGPVDLDQHGDYRVKEGRDDGAR